MYTPKTGDQGSIVAIQGKQPGLHAMRVPYFCLPAIWHGHLKKETKALGGVLL